MDSQRAVNTFRIPAAADAALVRMLEQVRKLNPVPQPIRLQSIGVPLEPVDGFDGLKQDYPGTDWENSRVITHGSTASDGEVHVYFERIVSEFQTNGHVERRRVSQWEMEVWLTWPNHVDPSPSLITKITSLIADLRGNSSQATLVSGSAEIGRVYAEQLAGLTNLHNKIVVDAENARQRALQDLEVQRRDAKAEADRLISEASQKAAALRDQADLEVSDRRAELEKIKQALDARAGELNDRDHMHERRRLRAGITKGLQERARKPEISPGARALRRNIFVFASALTAVFSALALISALEFGVAVKDGQAAPNLATYVLIGRMAVSAAVAGGLGFWTLTWFRRLHDADVRAERELERYAYDIDRASWAIETILEVQNKQPGSEAGEVPEQWIAGATHGLFARAEPRDEEHTAMEALGALLNIAAEAEIGPGGTRLKITPRGVRRLKRQGLLADETE